MRLRIRSIRIVVILVFSSFPVLGCGSDNGDTDELEDTVIEADGATITLPASGDVLVKIEENDGIGVATLYGSVDEDGKVNVNRLVVETHDEAVDSELDAEGRPVRVTIGSLDLQITYSTDGTFDVTMRMTDGSVYSADDVAIEYADSPS